MSLLPNSVEGKSAPYLTRVENVLAELDRMKGEYMAACKAKRDDIKEIYKEAKGDDVPVKALKGLVKHRELARKQAAIEETIPDEEVSEFQMLVEALGDFGETPLGQAALDLAGGDEDEEDVRPRFAKTDGEAPAKRSRKQKADAPKESPEEAAALADVEAGGIGGAAASFEVRH